MKRIILFLTAIALCLSLAACGAKAPAAITDPDAVTITVPAELAGVESKKQLKEQFSGEGYLDARLTDDGQVILVMTREKHQALLADTERSIRESLEVTASAEDNSFTRIEVNEDYTHYTVYTAEEALRTGENIYTANPNVQSFTFHRIRQCKLTAFDVNFYFFRQSNNFATD